MGRRKRALERLERLCLHAFSINLHAVSGLGQSEGVDSPNQQSTIFNMSLLAELFQFLELSHRHIGISSYIFRQTFIEICNSTLLYLYYGRSISFIHSSCNSSFNHHIPLSNAIDKKHAEPCSDKLFFHRLVGIIHQSQ